MLVFQPLQPGGRDVIFEGRPPLPRAPVLGAVVLLAFANLPWDFVYLWVTQSRKGRDLIPIIPRTVKVTYAG